MDADPKVEFCEREHPRLVGFLTVYTGDRDLAAELAQEALARACARWASVGEMDAPGAWVHTVAVNLARSSWRRRKYERRAQERVAARRAAPEPDAARTIALRAAVMALSERQRLAIVLRYFADLSVAETATIMQCREGTVRALTSQGVAALRTTLDEQHEDMAS